MSGDIFLIKNSGGSVIYNPNVIVHVAVHLAKPYIKSKGHACPHWFDISLKY
jgi:hypothetical protein